MDKERCVKEWLESQPPAAGADVNGYETAVDVAMVFLRTLGDAALSAWQVEIVKKRPELALLGLDAASQEQLDGLLPVLAAIFFKDLNGAAALFNELKWPQPFPLVLAEELADIKRRRGTRRRREPEQQAVVVSEPASVCPYRKAGAMGLTGLAFSGGGIRSATFNLGVLQRLSENGLLANIDYLSTVSGGGYIGGWFAAWVHRETSFERVLDWLSFTRHREPGATPLEPIRFLRRFSNYLTPQLGAFSFDTWAMLSVYARNVTLNLTLLLALFGSLLLVPRLLGHGLAWFTHYAIARSAMLGAGIFLVVVAVAVIGLNLEQVTAPQAAAAPPTADPKRKQRDIYGPRGVQLWAVAPLLLGCFLIFLWTWSRITWLATIDSFWDARVLIPSVLVLVASQVLWPPLLRRSVDRVASQHLQFTGMVVVALMTWLVSAFAGGAMWYRFVEILAWFHDPPGGGGAWHALVWGPPLLLLIMALVGLMQVGLMGVAFPDSGREWLSRFRGVLNIYSLAWVALFGISVYGGLAMAKLELWAGSVIGAGWVATTVASFLAGRRPPERSGQKSTSPLWNLLTAIGPPIFVLGFLWAISVGEHLVFAHATLAAGAQFTTSIVDHYWTVLDRSMMSDDRWMLASPETLGGLMAGVAFLLAWRIDINEFSMHNFYKNRLTRCYLGASNGARTPNSFSGFDESDDIPLSSLATHDGPYPIINAALNLTTGRDLAWQERKAASFVFTPLFCGYDLQLATGHSPARGAAKQRFDPLRRCAFRRTETYAFKGGVRLGTAMAISGAAADPNQGYNTAPALAFLMTVFNVRLGWWLGNPRRDFRSTLPGPVFGLAALVSELMGSTDDASNFVRLSDGGHFDNMGLYELVRRRCRYIILCDAEQDPTFQFGGLGMAIRKCRVDFGAEIAINPRCVAADPVTRRSLDHCAMGEITYADGTTGRLLYIKAALTGDEPEDLLQYSAQHADFPHETTADQWFAESQFESYRKLGYHAANQTIEPARLWAQMSSVSASGATPQWGMTDEGNVTALFDELTKHWSPVNPNLRPHATKHTATLVEILQHLGETPSLQVLGAKLFPGAPAATGQAVAAARDDVQEFYFCVRIVQLVEDIYYDFRLDELRWQSDPRIGGWQQLFSTWKKVAEVQEVWKSQRGAFRADFQVYWDGIK